MKRIIIMLLCAISTILSIRAFCAEPVRHDVIVAADGSGKFTSINEAILSIRDYDPAGRKVIFIKKGVYREKVLCPPNKTNITLLGEDADSTIIVWGDYAKLNDMGTFRTGTMRIEGFGFIAENLTIANDAGQIGQAVALHVEGDCAIFRKCRILGNQDTVFTGNENSRQYYEECYIEGTTDYVFGPATAWFEGCTLHSKRNSYITAASTPADKHGYIFNRCTLTADGDINKLMLGRPWRANAAVVFMNCEMGGFINKSGWHNWGKKENEETARYCEYNNTGEGADRSGRVEWSSELSKKQAKKLTIKNVFKGSDNWNPTK